MLAQSTSEMLMLRFAVTVRSLTINIGTALRAESSLIGVNGNITFLRNIGINGGALHLVLYSYLIMNRNSSLKIQQD